jgi:hypothetical protein
MSVLNVNHGALKDKLFMTSDFVSRILFSLCSVLMKPWGHAVAQLDEALRYKPEGRWFDFR